jgi:hypothetical protein
MRIGDVEITLNLDGLTWGDWEDLEEATQIKQVADWLEKHAGLTSEQRRAIPAAAMKGLKQRLLDEIWGGLVPNTNGGN